MKKKHYLIIVYKGNGSILIKLQITKGNNKITERSQTDKNHAQENPDNHSSRPGHINKDEAGKLE